MKNIKFVVIGLLALLINGQAQAQSNSDYKSLDAQLAHAISINSEIPLYIVSSGDLVELNNPRVVLDEELLKLNQDALIVLSNDGQSHAIENVLINREDAQNVLAKLQAKRAQTTKDALDIPFPDYMKDIH